jgi:hypothetical protein
MKLNSTLTAALVAIAAFGPSAYAQTCVGTAALDPARPYQAGGALGFTESTTSVAGSFTAAVWSLFGTIDVGSVGYNDLDARSVFVSGTAGWQIAADRARRFVLCPMGGVATEGGLENLAGSGVDVRILDVFGGFSTGFVLIDDARLRAVPTVDVSAVRSRVTFAFSGEEESEAQVFGVVTAGFGVVLWRRYSVVPAFALPFGTEDANTLFQIVVRVGLGG